MDQIGERICETGDRNFKHWRKKRMKKSEKWQHDLADMMKRNNLNYWSPTGRRDGEESIKSF